ncbi:hypothetical protein B0I35DRAFT_363654, partial [Stachybotrys elegans]
IEDYKPGYPRYSAVLASYNGYFVIRRFDNLRARLLLLKQDKLAVLEEQLQEIDEKEPCPLFLGSSRRDQNSERLRLLAEIDASLIDYDGFIEGTRRALGLPLAKQRDVESLRNWVDNTGCVARDESKYLQHKGDLVSLATTTDNALDQIESWVENKLTDYSRSFRNKPRGHATSLDPSVYHFTGHIIKRIATTVLLCIITLLLLMPVVICNLVETMFIRIIIVILSTIVYLITISLLTRSRTIELMVAGATYTTILIAFVSGTAGS